MSENLDLFKYLQGRFKTGFLIIILNEGKSSEIFNFNPKQYQGLNIVQEVVKAMAGWSYGPSIN